MAKITYFGVQTHRARQRSQAYVKACGALVLTPQSQHTGNEVAKSEPRPQSDRASLGDTEVPRQWEEVQQQKRAFPGVTRRMKPHPGRHPQRTCGVHAAKNEGCNQGKRLPD
uniref:Uncharacterized protein n=1 Tax=Acrobeloides nanus TaxID=290746 RepID=A0A914DZY0_9BILA